MQERSPKSQRLAGPSKQGWVGWVGSLISSGHRVRSIFLWDHTTNLIYSNFRLTKQTFGWNLSSQVYLFTKEDCLPWCEYSGLLVIIWVYTSVSEVWLMWIHLRKGKIGALINVVSFVVNKSAGNTLLFTQYTVMSTEYTTYPPPAMVAFAYEWWQDLKVLIIAK